MQTDIFRNFLLMALLIGGNAYAQTQLPKCVLFGFGNCIGTLRFSNGDIYTGEFNYGKPNGKGAFTYGNGDSYSGTIVEGQRHGSGTYTSAAGDKYVGQFSEGKFDGLGVYYFLANNRSRGDIYVGEFSSNTFNGQGRYTHSNGQVFVGSFSRGRKLFAEAAVAATPEPLGVAAEVSKQITVETPTVVAVPRSITTPVPVADMMAVQVSVPEAKVNPIPTSVGTAQQLYGSKDSAVKAPLAAESRKEEQANAYGERSKWYVTGGIGYWDVEPKCYPATCSISKNNWGASIGVGYDISQNIAVEGAMSSLGRYGFDWPSGANAPGDYYASSFGAVVQKELANKVNLLLGVGYARFDYQIKEIGFTNSKNQWYTADSSYYLLGIG